MSSSGALQIYQEGGVVFASRDSAEGICYENVFVRSRCRRRRRRTPPDMANPKVCGHSLSWREISVTAFPTRVVDNRVCGVWSIFDRITYFATTACENRRDDDTLHQLCRFLYSSDSARRRPFESVVNGVVVVAVRNPQQAQHSIGRHTFRRAHRRISAPELTRPTTTPGQGARCCIAGLRTSRTAERAMLAART